MSVEEQLREVTENETGFGYIGGKWWDIRKTAEDLLHAITCPIDGSLNTCKAIRFLYSLRGSRMEGIKPMTKWTPDVEACKEFERMDWVQL